MWLIDHPTMDGVAFPWMRAEVIGALRSLGDLAYQRDWWGRVTPDGGLDSLDLCIHVLYDDCRVLPDPASTVPSVLRAADVGAIRNLGVVLSEILEELGDSPNEAFVGHRLWPHMAAAARAAHAAMLGFEKDAAGESTI